MRIITRGVIDWATLEIEESDSYEYEGPIALAKSSGSAPTPVDPYQQAAAQYGLSTGTALYNAGLNRTNSVNPIGSTTWSTNQPNEGIAPPSAFPGGAPFSLGGGAYGAPSGDTTIPYGRNVTAGNVPPTYTQTTQLAPQFQSALEQPIDTSQIPGMPGGPSLQQNVNSAQNAVFNSQMGLLQPQEKMQSEQLDSQLANEGITPGSAAYDYAKQELGRQQGFENSQVANSAVTTGLGELPMLYGLGSTTLSNEIAARNAPINEFNALSGAPGATASATTPDISGAFGQQYQGALAGYNANIASNNANTQAGAGLASAALLAFMLA